MATWPPEEFVCSVCLEVLRDPATLPCGHTYCLLCIQKHWDQGTSKGECYCPQCRQVFNPRPTLARSTVLMEAMEKLRVRGNDRPPSPVYLTVTPSPPVSVPLGPPPVPVRPDLAGGAEGSTSEQCSLYPQLPVSSTKLCPLHQQVLELYCCNDKEHVCDDCSLLGHKGHQVVRPEEEKAEKQQELVQMQATIQKSIQDREKIIQLLPQATQAYKNSMQELQRENRELFAELVKSLALMGTQVEELLNVHEVSACTRAEGHSHGLRQEITQLRRQEEMLKGVAGMEDSISFLNAFFGIAPIGQVGGSDWGSPYPVSVIPGVRAAMGEFREGLQNFCRAHLANMFRAVNDATPAAVPSDQASAAESASLSPQTPKAQTSQSSVQVRSKQPLEPKTREEMLKFRFEPTLDGKTAFRQIKLSDGDRKATFRAENQNYPENPERFLFWRQILCLEPLAGSPYYWEVEWTGQKVTVGVTYKDIARTPSDDSSRLGHNEQSWTLYWTGSVFSFWHAGKETQLSGPKARRIGVYLDQQEGVLAFYRVSHGHADLIHSICTDFTGALFPGFRFWSGVGSTITICQLD
ncbi:finTRIM family, member 86 [Chanos chanos]|uniref:FinTRIM family, member 86 n=1 Tax=Chanos chanos TaxID=29144 RepID=A0A6J2VRV3_CHACN|nr:E3 ubiquitin/ISG15 ligase TRIM25-like [Chanos chanos]